MFSLVAVVATVLLFTVDGGKSSDEQWRKLQCVTYKWESESEWAELVKEGKAKCDKPPKPPNCDTKKKAKSEGKRCNYNVDEVKNNCAYGCGHRCVTYKASMVTNDDGEVPKKCRNQQMDGYKVKGGGWYTKSFEWRKCVIAGMEEYQTNDCYLFLSKWGVKKADLFTTGQDIRKIKCSTYILGTEQFSLQVPDTNFPKEKYKTGKCNFASSKDASKDDGKGCLVLTD